MSEGGSLLLERDRELGAISSAVSRLSDGVSSILVFEGPAGIGKSALAAAMVFAALAAGVRVVRGRAKEIERHRPFSVFSAAAAAAASTSSDLLADIASGPPTVVVVDDLQWADRASIALLERLLVATSQQPLLILLTLRPLPRSAAVDDLLASAHALRGQVLRPAVLSPSAVAALAERTVGMPVGVRLRASLLELGGNPMAVEQVVSGLLNDDALAPDGFGALEQSTAEPLPNARSSIRQTVRTLGPATFKLLGLASVLGSSCTSADLGLMTNRPQASVRDELAEATAAGVLAPVDGRVAFRHDTIHEAFYDDLPVLVRRALHADAASVLEAAEAPPAVVAEHAIRAAEHDAAAVGRLRRASAAAVALGATTVAVDLIAAARASGAVDESSYRTLADELADGPAGDA